MCRGVRATVTAVPSARPLQGTKGVNPDVIILEEASRVKWDVFAETVIPLMSVDGCVARDVHCM